MSEINNYIPISRKLFEHRFWCEERVYSRFEAWLDILQSTRFEDAELLIGNRLINIKRGQLPVSLRYLAERWKWSTKKVNNFLDLLQHAQMVTKETLKETGQTLLNICNYDRYNFDFEERKQRKKQEGNSEETIRKQRGNKCNNENNVNKENNVCLNAHTREHKQENHLVFPFNSEKFISAWNKLIEMPKWKKKVNNSLQIALNSLGKYDEEFAIELIEKCIEGNWQGVTFQNTPDDYEKWKRRKANVNPISANTNFKNENNLTNDERWGNK